MSLNTSPRWSGRTPRFTLLLPALLGMVALPTLTPDPLAAQDPGFVLDTIRVQVTSRSSSDLPYATRAVRVISAAEIARTPARTIAEVLSTQLGMDVQSRSPAQTDLSIRGGTFEQVLVLVDGIPMSDAQTGHFAFDLAVPLGEVERIEVLRGGASALYGSAAMTGVINIVTRRGGRGGELTLSGGSFGALEVGASAAGAARGVNLRGGVEVQRADGHRPGTDYENVQGRITGNAPVGNGVLRGEVGHALRDFGAANFYAAFPSYEETRTTTATLNWVPTAPSGISVEPRVSLRRHEDDFVLFRGQPERYRNQHTSTRVGGELLVRARPGSWIGWVAGGEAWSESLRSNSLGDHDEERGALFAEFSAGEAGRTALTGGLRYDHHSVFGGAWAPSMAFAIWPLDNVRLRASATQGFRSPTLNDRFYRDPGNIGSPDLDPERSVEVEAGIEADFGRRGRVDLGVFGRSASDLIDWARPSASPAEPWRTLNVTSATFRGVELEYEVRGPAEGRWSATGTLMSFESSAAEGYVSKYALRPLQELFTVGVDQPLADRLAVAPRISRARRNGEDPYFLLDTRITVRWARGEFFVDGTNLTDATFRDVTAVPGALPPPALPGTPEFIASPGRALRAGATIRTP